MYSRENLRKLADLCNLIGIPAPWSIYGIGSCTNWREIDRIYWSKKIVMDHFISTMIYHIIQILVIGIMIDLLAFSNQPWFAGKSSAIKMIFTARNLHLYWISQLATFDDQRVYLTLRWLSMIIVDLWGPYDALFLDPYWGSHLALFSSASAYHHLLVCLGSSLGWFRDPRQRL